MEITSEPHEDDEPDSLGWTWTIIFSTGITGATLALLFHFPVMILEMAMAAHT